MLWRNCTGRSGFCRKLSGIGGTRLELKKRIAQLSARIAAMQIPIYAGNASFFLLLSVFPIVSLLLSLLPYTPLTLEHLLGLCAQLAPDWLLRPRCSRAAAGLNPAAISMRWIRLCRSRSTAVSRRPRRR